MAESSTTQKLYLEFGLSNGKLLTLAISNPRANLTSAVIKPWMQAAVTAQAFVSGTYVINSISDAYYKTVEVDDIDLDSAG